MQDVFGIPAGALATGLAVALLLTAGAVTVLAARNLVFLKLGVRNIPRRRARSALIVVGLMLGTAIIASALLTGDSMGRTVRASTLESLGNTDEYVRLAGADESATGFADISTAVPYFDERLLGSVDEGVARSTLVDGVAPAIIELVAAQNPVSRRTEPRITLFASDPARLEPFGLTVLAELRPDQVLLDEDAAEELGAMAGDRVVLFAGDRMAEVTVAAIGSYRGTGTDGSAALMQLSGAQALLGRSHEINHVLVSNAGGETSGVGHTDHVVLLLDRATGSLGLEADPVKQDRLDMADAEGNAFMQLFTTFGSFSMAAGILLIFLIFVMLAAERRSEMGMARAIGTHRRHLVQSFLFEGAVYDLAAAAVGAALGVGVSYVMVRATASAFAAEDLELRFGLQPRSLLIAYAIGVLLTLAVVAVSAWRVSRLEIVSAIRDTAEPVRRVRRRRRWVFVGLGLAMGGLLTVSGAGSGQYVVFMLGVSLVIVSVVPLVRLLGATDRVAYTVAGFALVGWWMLPLDVFESLLGDMEMDFSIWIASGILVVLGSTWLVMYNADALLGALQRITSRFTSLAPVMKMAITYPLRSRFRTAVTLAMFMLVVFTLVTGATLTNAFVSAFDDVERFGGGWDVRAVSAPSLAIDDVRASLPESIASEVEAVGRQSFVPVEAHQTGTSSDFESYPLRGLDDEFLVNTTYQLATMAEGYESEAEVWAAVRSRPGLAVVDPYVVPRRQGFMGGVLPDFQLEGFYLEDQGFDPVTVDVRDPQTGTRLSVTVIGVLTDNAPYDMAGMSVSQDVVAPFGERAVPTVHHLRLREGADADATASALEGVFLANGLEAESYAGLLDDAVGASRMFTRLVQGFMGLGLLVGVAALGVISARAVVERRQQLGMLRAIGFQPEMIRRSLMIEASFVALTAIVVGTALGLGIAWNVISDASSLPNNDNLTFAVPWLNLLVVFGVVYVAALGTTLVPAMRASRVYPAEALRYQ